MKIFCVGRNYADHAKELGNTIDTEEPIIFLKPKSALLGKNVPFHYPSFTNELHYECEMVLRICKNGKYIQEKDAYKYYDALSTGIDFTARDLQKELKNKGLPWEKSKAFDDSAVIGKWLEFLPNKKLQDPFQFSLKKNNTIVQQGNTADMIFSFDKILAHISIYFSVNIGDVIFTGTPAGVGECIVGDVLEAFIEQEKMLEITIK
ncbi:MAG TPA: fumarylacetoacetate hydrolase family protein [Chitinophagaceae bacterium]|nr:fumarylacetoacetate hydrolase family protein [Chitinophagaceae bacterium]